jgi:hypothetical protein
MKKTLVQKTLTGLLAVALVGIAFQTRAEDKATEAKPETAAEVAKPKKDRLPFRGTVSAVDKTAMTISVKGKETEKTYLITSTTKFTKAGKPATLEDAVVGEECGGSYKKTEAGKLEALSVRLGPKPEKPEKKTKSKKPEGTNSIESK